MLVSIIIPVYNSAAWLRATIEAALGQTYPNKEIIIIDDNSTDDSYTIAQEYKEVGLRVIRQKNAGAAVARNTGLQLAKGKYIQFLDAGDLLSPGKIEVQVKALQANPGKVAVCNYRQFRNEAELADPGYPDQSRFIYSSSDPLDFLINLWGGKGASNFIQTNCWLVPRTLIDKAGGWRAYRCPDDDGEFFARVILASEGVVFVPGVFNYYRMSPETNQLSGNRSRKYLMNTLLTMDLKLRYLQQKGNHPGIKKAMAKQYLDFAVYHYPSHPVLCKLAFKRYKALGVKVQPPVIGGKLFEVTKQAFGWRAARLLRYVLREAKQG